MSDPEKITIEKNRIPQADTLDYVVHQGDIYSVQRDDYNMETYLLKIEGNDLPAEYKERWNDE